MDKMNQRVLLIGAARQGTALARYFIRRGASVTVTDLRSENELLEYIKTLKDEPIKWVLGEHPMNLLDNVDLVCVSGGVPLDAPIVVEARKRGIPLSNDSQIFLEVAPCKVIGITGSAGKTTTTKLVGRMAEFAAKETNLYRKAWIGGNVGNPLIDVVDEMHEEDIAVMELSSFQLEVMTISPNIAAVLNITPNHLDRHKTMDSYISAKSRIVEYQNNCDVAVLNRDDPQSWAFRKNVRGYLASFGMDENNDEYLDSYTDGDKVFIREGRRVLEICSRNEIKLRGEHNLMNVLAACSIAFSAGIPFDDIRKGILDFEGVEHRLEFVRSWGGAEWFNDSIATAPERAMAAIRSFNEPIILLAGGMDKDLPWDDFAKLVSRRVDHLILFGEAEELIANAMNPYLGTTRIIRCKKLHDAINAASEIVKPGDVVLLSPGGTSFDEFRDFAERGQFFRKWVNELP
ncbi:MAG: UDP-N-acetylmuramoyl-L-alanine--D-glutamate ligase [Anaerolineales bacterium]|nr:UDP-N-acetylmuramoyl-L-alanine--D-glutamate ligase [Anaerolineales bacterium]